MKKIFLPLLCIAFASSFSYGKSPRVDSLAVYILQKSNINLLNLQSCIYTAEVSYDVWGEEVGMIKHSYTDKIYMKFPNKLFLNSLGDKGHRSILYNGKNLSYYSFVNNSYAETSAPATVLETMDTINKTFGIEFPGADFFYPSFEEDILNTGSNLTYLGITRIGDKDCFHIAGKNENTSFQFWIANDELFLPVKMCITYLSEKDQPQYEAIYDNWEINPVCVDSMFEFTPPPGATKVKLSPTVVSKNK